MMNLRQLFVLGALGASLGLVFAQSFCVWDSGTFPGSYGCTNEDCGSGCGAPYLFQDFKKCKAGINAVGCCECSWTAWQCDCQFGTGSGSSSSQLSDLNWVCPESAAACIRSGGGGGPG